MAHVFGYQIVHYNRWHRDTGASPGRHEYWQPELEENHDKNFEHVQQFKQQSHGPSVTST
eukprot:45875-Rhodomonas_salina.6